MARNEDSRFTNTQAKQKLGGSSSKRLTGPIFPEEILIGGPKSGRKAKGSYKYSLYNPKKV